MKISRTIAHHLDPAASIIAGLLIAGSGWMAWESGHVTCVGPPLAGRIFGLHLVADLILLMPFFFIRWIVMVYLQTPGSLTYFVVNSLLLIVTAAASTGLWISAQRF